MCYISNIMFVSAFILILHHYMIHGNDSKLSGFEKIF